MNENGRKLQIGVVGSAGQEEYPLGGGASSRLLEKSRLLGRLLADRGVVVVTGGKGGVMDAVSKGVKSQGGITVGIVSGGNRFVSNPSTDIEVLTGASSDGFDEFLLVTMSDALIVLGGGAGTLQEIAIAYRQGKPIITLGETGGWADKVRGCYLDTRKIVKIESELSPEGAVDRIIELARVRHHGRSS